MSHPLILDLFCGQGGAAEGYRQAGLIPVGVDHRPQRRYPFEFHQADALVFLREQAQWLRSGASPFAAIHASPPCQAYGRTSRLHPSGVRMERRADGRDYLTSHPRLIEPLRQLLEQIGLPFVIENVEGAPLRNPLMICGQTLGLRLYRHRFFECSFPVRGPAHLPHERPQAPLGRRPLRDEMLAVVGNFVGVQEAREVMGMHWADRKGLAEAVPPAYTRLIGAHLMNHLEGKP